MVRLRIFFAALAWAALAASGAPGQGLSTAADLAQEQNARRTRLAAVESAIEADAPSAEEAASYREELRALRLQANGLAVRLSSARDEAARALEALGPVPGDGAPPEPSAIAAERAALAARRSDLDAAARLADLNSAMATQLIDRIAELRRERFWARALVRDASPFRAATWTNAARALRSELAAEYAAFEAWRRARVAAGAGWSTILVLLAAAVAAFLVSGPVRRRLRDGMFEALGGRGGADAPHRLAGVVAGVQTLGHVAAASASAAIVFAALVSQGVDGAPGSLLMVVTTAILFVAVADGAARGVLAPLRPAWRVAELHDRAARRVWRLTVGLAATAATAWMLDGAGRAFGAERDYFAALGLVVGAVGGGVLFLLARKSTWRGRDATEGASPPTRRRIRLALGLAALVALAAALAGYAELARLVVERAAIAVALALGVFALRVFAHGIAFGVILSRFRSGALRDDETVSFWIRAVIDLVLIMLVAPAALLIIGVDANDITDFLARAVVGVRVGSLTISLADIAVGVAAFFGMLVATRFVQRGLAESVLPRTRVDVGVRNSVVAIFGYAGLVIAFFVGLAAAGVNLTNFAIIAGALSVGVGFGLQGFVSNFVSGLTVLIERPVKIGDWVRTPSGEGYVRKIGIRATEIETFERASIIVPNSELVTSTVTNLTLRDAIGRVTIPVGVSYDADPDLVHRLMTEVVTSHPEALKTPAPFVYWKDFGDSALLFEARMFVTDISRTLAVQNELRFAIWRALKEHGIEIPFPQRVVHLAHGATAAEPHDEEPS